MNAMLGDQEAAKSDDHAPVSSFEDSVFTGLPVFAPFLFTWVRLERPKKNRWESAFTAPPVL